MIVSNASTLILLAKVNSLSQLLDDIKKIVIPHVVYQEIIAKEDSFEILLVKKEVENKGIVLANVNRKDYLSLLQQFKLDEGEAAAYELLRRVKGKAVLTDDRELIKLCKLQNVPFITAMSIIVKLYKKKKLSKKEAFKTLEKLYGYGRYSEEIYDFFKSRLLGVSKNGNNINKTKKS